MQHRIRIEEHGPCGDVMARAIESCVHCGFCLPACPTYDLLGEEMDSPRGRIYLMKEVLEGSLPLEESLPFVDRCLGCLACEPACPSGVEYGELVTSFRRTAGARRSRSPWERLVRSLVLGTLPYPRRLRCALALARGARWLRPVLPESLRAMLDLAPRRPARRSRRAPRETARAPVRARAAVLRGCAQEVLAPEIHEATVRVLERNGVEVVPAAGGSCCGALSFHAGAEAQARRLARRTMDAFAGDDCAILTSAAGCGSGMREYPLLFRGTDLESDARCFAGRVRDVSLFLDELGPAPPPPLAEPLRVAYHDACHLAHAQGVRSAPRRLLESIPGVELSTPAGWELCCGSAGTYNIDQPGIASRLGEKKARCLIETGARVIVSGNIGCITQIRHHLRRLGSSIAVLHTMELLDAAYRRDPNRLSS